jgi:biopolymer transport protein ExbB
MSPPEAGAPILEVTTGAQALLPSGDMAAGAGSSADLLPLLRDTLVDAVIDPTYRLLEAGGPVLWAIFAVSLLLWTLIVLRYLDLIHRHPKRLEAARREWAERSEHSSWFAQQVRRALISQLSVELHRSLPLIKALIAVCPLLGLLGTVTGMIHVFDVMAYVGGGNVKAMADGISLATIPTMAGMVVAISGLFFSANLSRRADLEANWAADQLRMAARPAQTPLDQIPTS